MRVTNTSAASRRSGISGIVHDSLRNETYARARAHHVKPGMRVFEIGTGLLAMLAVRGIEAGSGHHPEPESDQAPPRWQAMSEFDQEKPFNQATSNVPEMLFRQNDGIKNTPRPCSAKPAISDRAPLKIRLAREGGHPVFRFSGFPPPRERRGVCLEVPDSLIGWHTQTYSAAPRLACALPLRIRCDIGQDVIHQRVELESLCRAYDPDQMNLPGERPTDFEVAGLQRHALHIADAVGVGM